MRELNRQQTKAKERAAARPVRRFVTAGCASAVMLLGAGCGTADTSTDAMSGHDATGMRMGGDRSMPPGTQRIAGRGRAPSESARLVCGREIRGDIRQLFDVATLPPGRSTWAGGIFACTYLLPAGQLRLSVQDATDPLAGRDYFDAVRAKQGSPALLRGLPAFVLPAFETSAGRAVFLKDGKTLTVDATGLSHPPGPGHQSRMTLAYAVAADVIGCWSE